MSAIAAATLAVLGLAVPGLVRPALAGDDDQKPRKLKKPSLELRVSPRFSFSPAELMFTAELKGGDNVEEYYCPEVEWEWGDGGKSMQEADCDPWKPDTRIERRYVTHHVFSESGIYRTRITLRKSNRTIATRTVDVTVRPGFGDRSVAVPE